jgi:hypothetical protein
VEAVPTIAWNHCPRSLECAHISIEAESDHVRLELTDNSPSMAEDPEIGRMRLELRRRKGDLRSVILPAGAGMRFHLRVPQHLIVLDGMVVRIGRISYVLPIDAIQRILETDRLLPVTAGNKVSMLNLGDEGLIPVHPLTAWSPPEKGQSHLYVIVASSDHRMAIPVDELLGQQLVGQAAPASGRAGIGKGHERHRRTIRWRSRYGGRGQRACFGNACSLRPALPVTCLSDQTAPPFKRAGPF